MRKSIYPWAAGLLILSSSAGFAADAVATGPAPEAASSFNWSGAYVGAYAGGSFNRNQLRNLSGSTDVNLSPDGFTGGLLMGYNYQFDPVVVGVEAEFGYDGWKAGGDFLNSSFQTRHAESEGSYVGRIRARGGYAIDRLLLFAAGGVSFGRDKVTQSNPFSGASDTLAKDLTGWNVGIGAEYAFTSNWVGRLEYIHDSFGKQTYDFKDLTHGFANREVSLDENTVRVALEYKF